jgi:hypothetical protein
MGRVGVTQPMFLTGVCSADGWRPTDLNWVEQKYYRVFTGELWTFGELLNPAEEVTVEGPHHFTAVALRKLALV